jgi:ATP adenylyltransferase
VENGERAKVTGVGMPDRWARLWAPHRAAYIAGENRPLPGNEIPCPFCKIPEQTDELGLIVHRGASAYVVMNLYPYNAGHLLICTYRHVADLTELSAAERNELFELSATAMKVLRAVAHAKGFNLGMNQGAISGAGVAEHIHQHVVPRWSGDANFMPIIGGTKVLSQLLDVTRAELAKAWPEVAQ